jgi:hypothetical protein
MFNLKEVETLPSNSKTADTNQSMYHNLDESKDLQQHDALNDSM